ncbi:hypothetical protein ACFW04_006538 [Cataglyphis niger]
MLADDDVFSVVFSVIICSQVDVDEEDDNDEITSSLCSSSEEDSSDEESEMYILYAILIVNETRGETPHIEKLTDYVEQVISGYSKITFKQHFRMFPETFQMILRLLRQALNATNICGKKQLSSEKQLMITLWLLQIHIETNNIATVILSFCAHRSVCVKFGVGKTTALRAVRGVTYALYCLAPRFIKWPRGEEATSVIGAVDDSFIQIWAPQKNVASYISVCDARSLFTHCHAGHAGSMHDARVFRNSLLAEFIQKPDEYFPSNSHLLGDAAYSIYPHVVVPFRDNEHLTVRQKNFNYCLSSTRVAIERAFGLLKVRFRIMKEQYLEICGSIIKGS